MSLNLFYPSINNKYPGGVSRRYYDQGEIVSQNMRQSMNADNIEARELQVHKMVNELIHDIEYLEECIRHLEDRLSSVMTDIKKLTPDDEVRKDPGDLVILAQTILGIRDRVQGVSRRVEFALQRLEA